MIRARMMPIATATAILLCSFCQLSSVWAKKKKIDFPSQTMKLKVGEKTFLSYPGLKTVQVENSALVEVKKEPKDQTAKNNLFSLKAKARGSTNLTLTIQFFGNRGKPQKILLKVVVK